MPVYRNIGQYLPPNIKQAPAAYRSIWQTPVCFVPRSLFRQIRSLPFTVYADRLIRKCRCSGSPGAVDVFTHASSAAVHFPKRSQNIRRAVVKVFRDKRPQFFYLSLHALIFRRKRLHRSEFLKQSHHALADCS